MRESKKESGTLKWCFSEERRRYKEKTPSSAKIKPTPAACRCKSGNVPPADDAAALAYFCTCARACACVHTHTHTHTQCVKVLQPLRRRSSPCFFLTKIKILLRGLNPALCRDQDVAQSNPLRQDSNPGCNPLRRCTG